MTRLAAWKALENVRARLRMHFRSYRCALQNLMISILMVAASVFIIFYGLFRSKSRIPSSIVFSLTYAQAFKLSNIEDLLTYLKEKRFQEHFRVGSPLIEVRSIKTLLVRNNAITIDAPLFLLVKCVKRSHYGSFLMNVFKSVCVFRDREFLGLKEIKGLVFDLAVYKVLQQHFYPEFDLVTTNSSLKKLPFAFESPLKGRRVMIWYSTNSKPICFRGSQQSLNWDFDAVIKSINSHLVWTKYDIAFLESQGIKNSHAIGPILFQAQNVVQRSEDHYVITYFGITPLAPSHYYIEGTQENFYSEQNALSDLEAIEKLSANLMDEFADRVIVRIKPKRAYGPMHSKKYIGKIIEYSRKQEIELLSPDANLYEVVSQSDLVIATPWTSPAVLAKEMAFDSVFFAIRVAEWDLPDEYEGIRVINSLSELTKYVNVSVQKKLNK